MKVLVYGIGVIGSLTVHELCKAGNDVTVVSRGCWKEVLERQGLQIHSGKNKWIDYPKVLSKYDGQVLKCNVDSKKKENIRMIFYLLFKPVLDYDMKITRKL